MAKTTKAKKEPPRPYIMNRFGILNPWGQVWSVNTFDTSEEASRYLARFWGDQKNAVDLAKFKVSRVTVTITADP